MAPTENIVTDQHAAPTAGPFTIKQAPKGTVDLYSANADAPAVATFWGPSDAGPSAAEALANARAFVEVHTLMALAQEMVDVIEGRPSRNPFALVDDCRAVLARINGEQP